MDIRRWTSILTSATAVVALFSCIVVADYLFEAPYFCDAGDGVSSVAVGDLNGDGHPDLITANNYDDTVSIIMGNGDGTFQSPEDYEVGDRPKSVALRDLDGDTDLDLAVANFYGDNVSILRGNGDGSFQPAVDYIAGEGPCSLAINDLDGDANLDLIMANYYGGNVSVLLGNGDGTFQNPFFIDLDYDPTSVAVGDVNGDSIIDMVVSTSSEVDWGNLVTVLLGEGQGVFHVSGIYGAGEQPFFVDLHDLDGDGVFDMVVADIGRHDGYGYGHFYPGKVIIHRGVGDGTFQAAGIYYPDTCPYSIDCGDLDRDGDIDLAVASIGHWSIYNVFYPGSVVILLGEGDGTFECTEEYATGNGPYGIAIGELDNDQHLDLAIACPDLDSIAVFLGNGDGTFKTAVGLDAWYNPMAVAAGDLENDGDLDLVVANHGYDEDDYNIHHPGCVSIHFNKGDGTFQDAERLWIEDRLTAVALGDLDSDGDLDLAVAHYAYYDEDWIWHPGGVSIHLTNVGGPHQEAVHYEIGNVLGSVALGDLDGDGDLDLLAADGSDPNTIIVLKGNGGGTFDGAIYYEAIDVVSIALGDLDADGDIDIAGAHLSDDVVSVFLGNGDGTFEDAVDYDAGDRPSSVAIGDLDGDSDADLVTGNVTGDTVSVLLGNGDGTFQDAVHYDGGEAPRKVTTGYLNNDSILDLVVSNLYTNMITVLLGNGDGTFQDADQYGAGYDFRPYGIAIGDFDGDMAADIAATNYATDRITLFSSKPPYIPTIAADLTCQPSSGVVPFISAMSFTMANLYSEDKRRFAGRIDIDLARGRHIGNWRSGWTNLAPGGVYQGRWLQAIPAIGEVIGDNVFSLSARDVTPAPFNQPPYPTSGDVTTASCTVTGIAP